MSSTAASWFARTRIDDQITRFTEPYVHPAISANLWHIRGSNRDLLVDTGLGIELLYDAAGDLFARDPLAVATHAHYDHIGGMDEWPERAIHRLEAPGLETPGFATLLVADLPPEFRAMLGIVEGDGDELITRHPWKRFDAAAYCVRPTTATLLLDDGSVIDLGDRRLDVLHLPGHSPGSIGLWDAATGILFSGDAVYDGLLLDEIPGANVGAYVETMLRLRALPVEVVHPGHGESFGRSRLHEIIDAYVAKRA